MRHSVHRIVLSFGFTVAIGFTVALLAAPAQAAFAGANGKIVFRTNRDGNAEIYTMNADGSGRVDLTRNPAEDVDPRWSPDGSRIVFASDRSGIFQIYTMNADGTDVRQLTTLIGHNRRPSWTADGRILFQSDVDDPGQARDIFVMNADGSGITNLTNSPGIDDAFATASPRGGKIVFSSDRSGEYRLYLMNGSAPVREFTSGAGDIEANWSPSGNDLVFVRFGSSGGSELYVVHTDGTGLRQLTGTPNRVEFEPAWSPDGTQIVFHACSGSGDSQHCANYVINSDGTGEAEISTPRIPYLDTFTGDRLDPFWRGPFMIGGGTIASMTQANGELETSIPSAAPLDPAGFIAIAVNSQCMLSGDFDVQADYRLLQWPAPHGVDVGFATNTSDFAFGYGMFVFDPGTGTGLGTGFPGSVNTFVPSVPPAGTLRLTRSGSTITAFRLTDTGWSAIQSTPATLADQELTLDVFSNALPGTNGDVSVAYDNVRVSSGTFSCPSWWGDEAPDWQPIPK